MRTFAVAMTVAVIAMSVAPTQAQPAPQPATSHIKASAVRAAKPDQTIHGNTGNASHATGNIIAAAVEELRSITAHILK